jgi:hypothetical protein
MAVPGAANSMRPAPKSLVVERASVRVVLATETILSRR